MMPRANALRILHRTRWHRRAGICLCTMALGLHPGCRAVHHWKHRHDPPTAEDQTCVSSLPAIQRRFYVIARGPSGTAGPPFGLGAEVVAAINALPNCDAVLLPPDVRPGPPGPLPPGEAEAFRPLPDGPPPPPTVDEVLIIEITESQPFRPMRLSALVERRSPSDGMVIAREHRTWTAPLDTEPLAPHSFNHLILNHPPPLGVVEQHELARLSPRTFHQRVAQELAAELAISPF